MRFVHLMILGLLLASCEGLFHSDPWVPVTAVSIEQDGVKYNFNILYDKTRVTRSEGKARMWVKSVSTTDNAYDKRFFLEIDKFERTIKNISSEDITPEARATLLNKKIEDGEKSATEYSENKMPESTIKQYRSRSEYEMFKQAYYYAVLPKPVPVIGFSKIIAPDSTEEKLYAKIFK